MRKTVEIFKMENTIKIIRNGRASDILISDLRMIVSGSNNHSYWIIYLAGKTDYSSTQNREELLLPLAVLIEKYHPNTINWFSTFKNVEGMLNCTANSNYNDSKIEDNSIEVNEFINDALSNAIEQEVDTPEIDNSIKNYLKANSLPFQFSVA